MKNNIALIVILLVMGTAYSQQPTTSSVEYSIFNIQTGFGLWVNNEARWSDQVAIRSEIGLNGAFQISGNESSHALVPGISIEPRWYYNLDKRNKQGKTIKNNSANYWSVKTFYLSDSFVFATNSAELESDQLNITLSWGFKRNFSNHWHYELGVGLGIDALYDKEAHSLESHNSNLVGSLTVRIGYKL